MSLHEYRLKSGVWTPTLGGGARRTVNLGSGGGVAPTGPDPALWAMDYDEQFTGTTVNTGHWQVMNNTHASNEDSWLLAQNVTVSGGMLNIQAKLEAAGGFNYTSGYLKTDGLWSTTSNYFRAAVRAQLTQEYGMWGAPLWFRPSDGAGANEIDVVENWGLEVNKAHYTMHSGTSYTSDHHQSAWTLNLPDPTGWHLWEIEKIPNQITTWCDGVLQHRWTPADSNLASSWNAAFEVTARRWSARCNLQVGGTWPDPVTSKPNSTTNWANTTQRVDYITIWNYIGA